MKRIGQYFPFPSSFLVTFHSTLLFFATLFSSLSKPIATHPIETYSLTIDTCTLQTKTLMVQSTQAPVKCKDKDNCVIYWFSTADHKKM